MADNNQTAQSGWFVKPTIDTIPRSHSPEWECIQQLI